MHCRGILKGIHDFDRNSTTEYKGWAGDVPSDSFERILDDWGSLFTERSARLKMENFLHANCPEWADRSVRQLRKRGGDGVG